MMQSYLFSVSSDFPNQAVNISGLTRSIENSSISSAPFNSISVTGDECKINFDSALDAGDVTTLDGIVATHDGKPFPTFDTKKFEFNDFLKMYPIFLACVDYNECQTGKAIIDYALAQGHITQSLHNWIVSVYQKFQ